MANPFRRPFTRAEMESMRRAFRDERGVLADTWSVLGRVAARLPFAEDVAAAYYCARDPATPRRVKLTLLAALAYFVLPTDAIADFLPLLGFADDAAVIATAIATVSGSITPEHRARAKSALASAGRAEA